MIKALGFLAYAAGLFCLRVYVLFCGYNWLLMPIGAPAIDMWHLAGAAVVVQYVTAPPQFLKDEMTLKGLHLMNVSAAYTLIVWAMFWLYATLAY